MRASLARSRRRVPKVTSAAHGPGHKMQECPIATERRHETASRLDAPAVRRTGFRQDRAGVAGRAMERGSGGLRRSEEHTSELQSLMRNSYAVLCLKKKNESTEKLQEPVNYGPNTKKTRK